MCELADYKRDQYCRICLLDLEGDTDVSVFFTYDGMKIMEHIKIITNIDISKNYSIPNSQYICRSCYQECKTAINFKKKCEETNLQLQSQSKYDIKKELKTESDADDDYKECHVSQVDLELDPISESKQEILVQTFDFDETMKEETFTCKKCKKSFENTNEMDSHDAVCECRLKCDDCGKFFDNNFKLKTHWRKEHLKSKLFCHRCKRHFKSLKALHNHKNRKACRCLDEQWVKVEGMDKKRVFCCKKCNYKTSSIAGITLIVNHIRSHRGDKPFKCSLCNLSFLKLEGLKTHEAYGHKISTLPSLQCEECGKTIIGKERLRRHMSHHRSPKQKCSICNKMIKKRGFKTHMLRHGDVKTFVCEVCALSFYTLGGLSTHKKKAHLSSDEKEAHSCDICGYVSYNKYVIKSHIQKHSKSTHACGSCGKFLNDELRLAKHKLYHERGRIYKCDYCDHSYFTSRAKCYHMRQKHASIHRVQSVSRKPLIDSVND